jgi:hypothetical protein
MEFLYNLVFENPISKLFRRELKTTEQKKKYSKIAQHFIGFSLIFVMMVFIIFLTFGALL